MEPEEGPVQVWSSLTFPAWRPSQDVSTSKFLGRPETTKPWNDKPIDITAAHHDVFVNVQKTKQITDHFSICTINANASVHVQQVPSIDLSYQLLVSSHVSASKLRTSQVFRRPTPRPHAAQPATPATARPPGRCRCRWPWYQDHKSWRRKLKKLELKRKLKQFADIQKFDGKLKETWMRWRTG